MTSKKPSKVSPQLISRRVNPPFQNQRRPWNESVHQLVKSFADGNAHIGQLQVVLEGRRREASDARAEQNAAIMDLAEYEPDFPEVRGI